MGTGNGEMWEAKMSTTGRGGVKGLVGRARRAAQRRGQRPSTAHLLLVMLQSGEEAGELLTTHGVREGDLLSALKVVDPESSSTFDRLLERSQKLARRLGAEDTHPLHVLLALTREPRSAAHRSLEQMGAGTQRLRHDLMTRLGVDAMAPSAPPSRARPAGLDRGRPTSRAPVARRRPTDPRPRRTAPRNGADTQAPETHPSETQAPETEAPTASPIEASAEARRESRSGNRSPGRRATSERRIASTSPGADVLDPALCPTLCAIGRNLTALAEEGLIDPVVGRDREIEQVLDVLARRRSNNPVLVGPPGVGKTAIAEGVALRLAEGGEGLRGLEGRVLVELSAGALVSGTGIRGAVAERVKAIREEVARVEGRVILFIDEIHAIVGGDGPDDLAHELKAALARGELPCIGATTDVEYRKYFEKDQALVRRFSPVLVDEPGPEDALVILRGIAPRYEMHHSVAYTPEALRAAVELSVRYVPDRRLPDKAIGIIDLAAARVRRRDGRIVGREAIASVVGELAGVPADRLLLRDADQLLSLEAHLAERVVGHETNLRRISDALRKGAAGFRGRRPLGTFLLLGPTGVGKTETAKAVAEIFFPGSPVTRLDMSEFAEAHAVARLLGAPPGYLGHDDGGQLTEPVRRRPYQLVLLDEVEKAHRDVLLALLPLLDEGRLTDGRGRTVDFTNTIVMMTSNLGVGASAAPRIGFGGPSGDTGEAARGLEAAQRALPPELWNRIDEPLWFGSLGRAEVAVIARRLLRGLTALMKREHELELVIEDTAIDALVAAGGYDAALGARPMKRIIGRLVEAPLASAVLAREVVAGDVVRLRGHDQTVRIVRGVARGDGVRREMDAAE